ncbi:MAG: hypothetical protein AAB320_03400 [Elusimicrobiota bacterium]
MKKSMLSVSAGLIAAGSLFLMGCMTYPLTISPSTKPITANDIVTEIGPASGSAWYTIIMGLPVGEQHQVGPALKRALESSGGDALIEVKMEYHTYNLMFATILRTDIYGTAVKIKKGGAR